jgi:hypothetical protein
MKRFLVSLLMLVMVTPSLACGPFLCAGKAHAAAISMQGMPCHDMSTKQKQSNGPMLFKDCSHIDLQTSGDATVLKKPDFRSYAIAFITAVSATQPLLLPSGLKTIRGPPEWVELSQAYPPLYLTTQRLRI